MSRGCKVAIVGSDYLAYWVALRLASRFPSLTLELIVEAEESEDRLIQSIGGGNAFSNIGVTEAQLLKAGAGITMGVNFVPGKTSFCFSESEYGFMMGGVRFHHLYADHLKRHAGAAIDEFCLSAQLAKNGRFAPRAENSQSILSLVNYGFSIGNRDLCALLKGRLITRGVRCVTGKVVDVDHSAGHIVSASLDSGVTVGADLFIDCTAEGRLFSELSSAFVDSSKYIPFYQTTVSYFESKPDLYGRIDVHPSTDRLTCLAQAAGRGYETMHVYADAGEPGGGLFLRPGYVDTPWVGNCVLLGPALWRIPALILTELRVVESMMSKLFEWWPCSEGADAERRAFNRNASLELSHTLDVENFLLNAVFGEKRLPLTERNAMRRQIFSAHGKLPLFEGDVLENDSWAALMLGFGCVPSEQHMLVSRLPPEEIDRQLLKVKGRFEQVVAEASSASDVMRGA